MDGDPSMRWLVRDIRELHPHVSDERVEQAASALYPVVLGARNGHLIDSAVIDAAIAEARVILLGVR